MSFSYIDAKKYAIVFSSAIRFCVWCDKVLLFPGFEHD